MHTNVQVTGGATCQLWPVCSNKQHVSVLREILETSNTIKLLWDWEQDMEALLDSFNIALDPEHTIGLRVSVFAALLPSM